MSKFPHKEWVSIGMYLTYNQLTETYWYVIGAKQNKFSTVNPFILKLLRMQQQPLWILWFNLIYVTLSAVLKFVNLVF